MSKQMPSGDNHWTKTQPQRRARGERIHTAKLTETQINEIRQKYSTGFFKQKDLAEMFKVNQSQISRIVNGLRWNGDAGGAGAGVAADQAADLAEGHRVNQVYRPTQADIHLAAAIQGGD